MSRYIYGQIWHFFTPKFQNQKQKEQNQKLVDDLKEQQLNEAVKENKILPAEKELLKEMNLNTLKEYLTKREPLGHTKDLNTNTQNQNSKDSAYAVAANLGWE